MVSAVRQLQFDAPVFLQRLIRGARFDRLELAVARRDEPIDVKVRDFLKVRLREVCPRCSGKIRRAGVRGMDAYFCPRCQPATRPGFVDWTKTQG